MNKIIIESAQGLAVSLTITVLIAVFFVSWLKLMFRIMDKIENRNRAFGPKDRPVTEAIKRKPERFKEGGVVHLNIPEVKPPMPTAPAQPPQRCHCTVNELAEEINKRQRVDYERAVQAMKWLCENTTTHHVDDDSGGYTVNGGVFDVRIESFHTISGIELIEMAKELGWGYE